MTTTNRAPCPESGVWRAWLDHEVEDDLTAHLTSCPGCREVVADLRADADHASAALASLAPATLPSSAHAALARERFDWRGRAAGTKQRQPGRLAGAPTSWRIAASGIAAAIVVAVVVAFTPEGRTAAAAFLAQFRSQQVAAIDITPQSQTDIHRTFQTLNNLGTVQGASPQELRGNEQRSAQQNLSLDDAARQVGFALKTPDPATLPPGMDKTPRIGVTQAMQERFTFSKAKAAAYFQSTGHPDVTLPDKFDGATLVVSIPAAALLQYGSTAQGGARDALVIGQAGEIEVDVQGNVSLAELRDFLLSLPGLPASTVAQLRQIQNWSDTLPIPVPVDKVNWQQASFAGGQGLLLNDNSGVGSAAIWQSGGHLYGVAGSLKATDLKRVADSLASR